MSQVLQHLTYRGAHADIRFDCKRMVFVGEIVNIPDCIKFLVDRYEDIESAFHRIVDNYVAFYDVAKSPNPQKANEAIPDISTRSYTQDEIINAYADAVMEALKTANNEKLSSAARTEARKQYVMYYTGYLALCEQKERKGRTVLYLR